MGGVPDEREPDGHYKLRAALYRVLGDDLGAWAHSVIGRQKGFDDGDAVVYEFISGGGRISPFATTMGMLVVTAEKFRFVYFNVTILGIAWYGKERMLPFATRYNMRKIREYDTGAATEVYLADPASVEEITMHLAALRRSHWSLVREAMGLWWRYLWRKPNGPQH